MNIISRKRTFYLFDSMTHVIHDVCPSFHCYTLKYRQHGQENIIKRSYALVWSSPNGRIACTVEATTAMSPSYVRRTANARTYKFTIEFT